MGLGLRSGARVILGNCGETPYDEVATLQAWASIAEVIPPAVERSSRSLGERP